MRPDMTFFMHDILGGSVPSGRVVGGNVANNEVTNLPFSKPNKGLFRLNGGIPLVGVNNLNAQNVPFLAGAGGNNNAVAGINNLPFITAGQLLAGSTLQNLLFGMITVIDEIMEGQELGSSVIGKARGFHLSSSLDGSIRTMAFTAMFGDSGGEEEEEDNIRLFGVHRTAAPVSLIAIVDGTGKYAEASGYAEIEMLHGFDMHITDGVETLLQINVHLTK